MKMRNIYFLLVENKRKFESGSMSKRTSFVVSYLSFAGISSALSSVLI